MEFRNNNILFNNDDDFYYFAVIPKLNIYKWEYGYYSDWDFTPSYKKAIEEGKNFIICDENSLTAKDGLISYRGITKKVENLKFYYGKQFIE